MPALPRQRPGLRLKARFGGPFAWCALATTVADIQKLQSKLDFFPLYVGYA